MYQPSVNWFEKKWFIVKQTWQQLKNIFCNQQLTPRGENAYDYCCKVIFDNYEPTSYAETMFEKDIETIMTEAGIDRETAALCCAGRLAKHIAPWDFWKKKHKIIGC